MKVARGQRTSPRQPRRSRMTGVLNILFVRRLSPETQAFVVNPGAKVTPGFLEKPMKKTLHVQVDEGARRLAAIRASELGTSA